MRTWAILNNIGELTGTIVETGNVYINYDKNGMVKASAVKYGNTIVQYNRFGFPERTLVEISANPFDLSMPDPSLLFK
jgi:hypothetical protein